MYEPKFRYTNKLVNLISQISAADAVTKNTRLFSSYDLLFKDSAMVKSAHYSTLIAGNSLSLKNTNQLFNSEDVEADDDSINMVTNYFYVMENLDEYIDDEGLSLSSLANLNKDLTMDTLENPEHSAGYRDPEVMKFVSDFLKWLNNEEELHPVLTAAIVYHTIATRLPFFSGNGKTARIMVSLVFKLKNFNNSGYYSFDEQIYNEIVSCNEALLKGAETGDITEWLEYFARAMLVSILGGHGRSQEDPQ